MRPVWIASIIACSALVACEDVAPPNTGQSAGTSKEAPPPPEEPSKTDPPPGDVPGVPAEPAPEEPGEPPTSPAGKGGEISGVVIFEGAAPPETKIEMKSDPNCIKLPGDKMTSDYVVRKGKLANVLVYVKSEIPADKIPKPSEEPVVIDQSGCRYQPEVLGIQTKQTLEIRNSDPTLHNIHAFGKQEFNVGMPTQGQKITKSFKKSELMVSVKCDVHPWMQAHIGAFDHPYFAVSNAAGAFKISGLPPGNHLIEAWHPKLGTKTSSAAVVVADGAEARLNFTFKAK